MSTPPDRLSQPSVPRHVAIIMDGNGRWAKQRFLPRPAGHKAGVGAVRKTVEHCIAKGIEVLTLFAFSSENWRRPPQEVDLLMQLFLASLERETVKLHRNGVRLRIIGDLEQFAPVLQARIAEAESMTAGNDKMTLVIAANFGGRWDVARACRELAAEVEAGRLRSEDVTEDLIASRLVLADLPEPDLFIRTGGEQRISNFLLWQLAYTELHFTSLLWPDFDEAAFDVALNSFASRQRRFGHTGDQVEQMQQSRTTITR